MTVGLGISPGLLLTAVTVRVCLSPRPAVMPVRLTVCRGAVPVFSRIAGGLVIVASVGAWLTGVTTTLNDRLIEGTAPLATPPLSSTVTVIVALPLTLVTGLKVKAPKVLLGK